MPPGSMDEVARITIIQAALICYMPADLMILPYFLRIFYPFVFLGGLEESIA
jgi:hypothetical protein